jgi:hypothetical protein
MRGRLGEDYVYPGLVPKPFPEGLQYIFNTAVVDDEEGVPRFRIGGWFGELHAARANSGFGSSPISYLEIKAWAELTGRTPSPLEIMALRGLDSLFIRTFNG